MAERIVLSPAFNSLYFSEATNNGLNVLGQADFRHQIQPTQFPVNYFEKAVTTDLISLQFHINQGYTPTLYITDKNQKVIAAITATLNAAPFNKGAQTVTGNTYANPLTGVSTPLATFQWAFTFNDFIGSLTTPDYYYVKLVVNDGSTDKEYYSEMIFLNTSQKDYYDWETGQLNTIYFQGQYNSNRAQNTNVISGGWFNDFPTNTQPWVFQSAQRWEGKVDVIDMKAVNIGYLQQNYNQLFVTGQQVPMRMLSVGVNSLGIPDYGLQMVTEMILADRFFINGTWYKISNAGGGTAPNDLWKSSRDEVFPLLSANTVITLGDIRQQAMVTPTPTPGTRIYNGVFNGVFA